MFENLFTKPIEKLKVSQPQKNIFDGLFNVDITTSHTIPTKQEKAKTLINDMIKSGQATTTFPTSLPIKEKTGFFTPIPKVRIRDVIREIPSAFKKITGKVFGTQEDLKSAYEKAKPTKYDTPEGGIRTTIYGVTIKTGNKYKALDPFAIGGMRNVAKEGLDAIGRQLLQNIKKAIPEMIEQAGKVAKQVKPTPKSLQPLVQEARKLDTTVGGHLVNEAEANYKTFKPLNTLPKWALEDEFGIGKVPSKLTVYNAGKKITGKPIFVTTDINYAREFLKPGEKITTFKDVPISELRVYGEGRITATNRFTKTQGQEFVYKPINQSVKGVEPLAQGTGLKLSIEDTLKNEFGTILQRHKNIGNKIRPYEYFVDEKNIDIHHGVTGKKIGTINSQTFEIIEGDKQRIQPILDTLKQESRKTILELEKEKTITVRKMEEIKSLEDFYNQVTKGAKRVGIPELKEYVGEASKRIQWKIDRLENKIFKQPIALRGITDTEFVSIQKGGIPGDWFSEDLTEALSYGYRRAKAKNETPYLLIAKKSVDVSKQIGKAEDILGITDIEGNILWKTTKGAKISAEGVAPKATLKTEANFRNFDDINKFLKKHGSELPDTELTRYNEIAEKLYQIEEENAYRQAFGDIKNMPKFFGEEENQYKNFKEITKKLYGSIKKFVENAEDVGNIEKIAQKKGLMNQLHNSLYSQTKSADELLDTFKEAIKKEYGYGVMKPMAEKVSPVLKQLAIKKSNFDKRIKEFIIKQAPQLKTNFLYSVKKEFRRNLSAKALQKYGDEGKQIYNKIKSGKLWAIKKEADAIVRLDEPFKKLNENDFLNFGDYVEGKKMIPKNVEEAVKTWQTIADEISVRAQKYGVKIKNLDGVERVFTPLKKYYPAFVKEEKLAEIFANQTKYRNFLEDMALENNTTVAEAHRIIQKMVNSRADFYGHLERSREAKLPKEFYERDPRKILAQYIHEAYQRLGVVKKFGGKNEKLQNLIQTALEKGEDFEEIQLLTDRVLGMEKFNKDLVNISAFARTYQNITKLSLVAITNISDISKAFIRTNFFSGMKGLVTSFTKEGKIFSRKAGVLDTQLYEYAKLHHLGTTFYKYTGFKWTEMEVRRTMALASKNYIKLLYNKLVKNPNNAFVRRRLEQFNLDYQELLQKGLTKDDLITGAIKAIGDSQPISLIDLPYRWQSPTGKLLTQYKPFAYKQWEFAKEFIFKEVRQGNIKPLLLFLLVGQAIGEPVADLKAWARGRERPKELPLRMIDNLMTIGGLGLATDFLSNLQYGSYGGGFLKFIVGPTLSDIDAWTTAIQGDINTLMTDKEFVALRKVKKDERQVKTAKKLIYALPFFGPALANKLFPTRSLYKARTIPIAEEILQLMEEENAKVIKPKILKPNIQKPNILKPNR